MGLSLTPITHVSASPLFDPGRSALRPWAEGPRADRHADPEKVAAKLMMWAWKLGQEGRGGLTTPQFIRAHLMRLGLGHDLLAFKCGCKRVIAPVDELLALRPELAPSS